MSLSIKTKMYLVGEKLVSYGIIKSNPDERNGYFCNDEIIEFSKNIGTVLNHLKMSKYLKWKRKEGFDYGKFVDEKASMDLVESGIIILMVYLADNVENIYNMDHDMLRLQSLINYQKLMHIID